MQCFFYKIKIFSTHRIFFVVFMLFLSRVNAQSSGSFLGIWNIQHANGSIALEGRYAEQKSQFINGRQNSYLSKIFFGVLSLNLKTNIWHPKFLLLDLQGEYRPGIRSDEFLITPFRTETNTLSRFYSRATFFADKPVNFSFYTNFSENQIDREFTTSVNIKKTNYGGSFSWQNHFMPIRLEYVIENWKQKELAIDRTLINKSRRFRSSLSKSFGHFDNGQIKVSYQKYKREYSNNDFTQNRLLDATIEENIKFDKEGRNTFISRAWFLKQAGDDDFQRILINENLNLSLPWDFSLQGTYAYNNWKQNIIATQQHNINAKLMHQLYSSLKSNARIEFVNLNHTDYTQVIKAWGGGVHYQKKIPTGKITFSYDYDKRNEDRRSKSDQLRVRNEEHVLDDNSVVLLENANVILNSVVIWDAGRTIQYQENIDYILIPRNLFIEIKRLTGGQIEPGSTVVVDYFVSQTPVEQYDKTRNAYGASLTVFNGFIELYGRFINQDFENIKITDSQFLKTINQRTIGARVSYGYLMLGYEKDKYESNIIPYNTEKYFVRLSGIIDQKFSFAVNGNLRELKLIQDKEKQIFKDISIRLSYFITRKIKLNLNGGYRIQKGRQIDLNLLSFRGEIVSRFRQVTISAGAEKFKRTFIGEKVDYGNFFLRIERSF